MIDHQAMLRVLQRQHMLPFYEKAFATVAGNTLKPNWHLKAIAYHLDEVVAGRIKRLVINVPPRSSKSIFASVALPAFLLGRNPRDQIICVSYAQDLAITLHNQCRTVMRAEWYRKLFPNTEFSPHKNNETEFMTTRGGGRFATSVGGVLTGRGGNILIIDDPMKPTDALSETANKKTNDWYDMTVLSRLNDKVEGAIIVVMQRIHVDDLAGHLLDQGGWTHLKLPAIAEEEEWIPIGPGRTHHRRVGDLLHPAFEPQSALDELKRTMTTLDFSAQYQQQPIPVGGNLFKWEWFGTFSAQPWADDYDEVIQSWDTASKDGVMNDHSVCTTWLIKDTNYYLLDLHRERLNFPDLRRRVLDLADHYRPSAILIEDKASGLHLIQELRNTSGHSIIAIEPQGDKLSRASTSALEIEAGRVFLPERAEVGGRSFGASSWPFLMPATTIRSIACRNSCSGRGSASKTCRGFASCEGAESVVCERQGQWMSAQTRRNRLRVRRVFGVAPVARCGREQFIFPGHRRTADGPHASFGV